MAGIFDRIAPSEDRVGSHLLKAAMHLAVYGVFTNQQLLDGINSKLTTELDSAAQTDLNDIRVAIVAQTGVNRLVALERFDAMNIAIETGVLTNEATYRSQLGIS